MIMENGLSFITVEKSKLLEALKENKEKHRAVFLEALSGYKEAVIQELERSLADAKAGRKYNKVVLLDEPVDQTKSYTRVIRMLEMSINDQIQISEKEFSQYVLDDWSWKHQFEAVSASYMKR